VKRCYSAFPGTSSPGPGTSGRPRSRRRQADVDLALVLRIDVTVDQRPFARFQRADDPRHLRRQHAQKSLQVADDQRAVVLQERQGHELDVGQADLVPAIARPGHPQAGQQTQQFLCKLVETYPGPGGNHRARSPSGDWDHPGGAGGTSSGAGVFVDYR
jgi:hypothetical protein